MGLSSALQILMKVADKYDMPAIMERCTSFLMSNMNQLTHVRDRMEFGWKWIALADAVGQNKVARACFDAKRHDVEFARPCHYKNLLSQLSPAMWQHILMTYASQQYYW